MLKWKLYGAIVRFSSDSLNYISGISIIHEFNRYIENKFRRRNMENETTLYAYSMFKWKRRQQQFNGNDLF